MIERTGDIWEQTADAVVITTNGIVNSAGSMVMGKGIAKEAAQRWSRLPYYLGQAHSREPKKVRVVLATTLSRLGPSTSNPIAPPYDLVAYQVKRHWRDPADLDLIVESARELVSCADRYNWEKVAMPRPGCGAGRLKWEQVKPLIEDILDDRFEVYTFG